MMNLQTTILSQYANSNVLLGLIDSLNDALDPVDIVDSFYDNIMNLDTAVGYGLDVWGRIVGVDRVLQVDSSKYFGFQEAGTDSITGFGQAPFYSDSVITNYALSDKAFRTLIYAKGLANITDGSVKDINTILLTLFPNRGTCYCTDPGDNTMQIVVDFYLQPFELSILQNSSVIPRPPGISQTVVYNYNAAFGTARLDQFMLDENQLG